MIFVLPTVLTRASERGSMRDMFDKERAASLIAGGKSLRQVGEELGCSASHICETAQADPSFGERYARAMAIRAEADVAELPVLRERMLRGEITPDQARVAADLIKWPASKRLPKVYGDKLQVDQDLRIQVELIDATSPQLVHEAPALLLKPQEDPLPE